MKPHEQIKQYVDNAYKALESAKELADEHGLSFSFTPAYGMGGTYRPSRMTKEDALELLRGTDPLTDDQRQKIVKALDEDEYGYHETGWVSSSHNC